MIVGEKRGEGGGGKEGAITVIHSKGGSRRRRHRKCRRRLTCVRAHRRTADYYARRYIFEVTLPRRLPVRNEHAPSRARRVLLVVQPDWGFCRHPASGIKHWRFQGEARSLRRFIEKRDNFRRLSGINQRREYRKNQQRRSAYCFKRRKQPCSDMEIETGLASRRHMIRR